MHSLYGRSPLFGAGSYALISGRQGSCLSRGVVTLSFAGGCLATVIFYATLLWSRRVLAAGLLGIALMAGLLSAAKSLGDFDLPRRHRGTPLGCRAVQPFRRRRSRAYWRSPSPTFGARGTPNRLCWFFGRRGRSSFAGLLNWTVNGRTILPMAPAASILIVRRIDRYGKGCRWAGRSPGVLPLVFVGFWRRRSPGPTRDGRTPPVRPPAECATGTAAQKATVCFAGHWGFQYYMESYGFAAIDTLKERLLPGNVVIVPHFGSNVPRIPPEACAKTTTRICVCPCLTTMCPASGTAFYGSHWGLLPFAFGPAPDDRYYVITMARAS